MSVVGGCCFNLLQKKNFEILREEDRVSESEKERE